MRRTDDSNLITLSDFGLVQADISTVAGNFKSFAEEINGIAHEYQKWKTKGTVTGIIIVILYIVISFNYPFFILFLFILAVFFSSKSSAEKNTEDQFSLLKFFNDNTEMMSRFAEIESKLSVIEKIEKYEDMLIANKVRGVFKDKEYISNLSGLDFEKEMSKTFKALGMHATLTSASNDRDIDIFLRNGAKKIAVQCKHQRAKVSPAVARDLLGAMTSESCDESLLISTGGFTSNTLAFCQKNSIKKMDINDVLELRRKLISEGKLNIFTS